MADIVVIGAGMGGLSTALLLADDGHHVTVLERDPTPPPASGHEAWDSWDRRGVNQFRMIHYFLPRFREVAERELPQVVKALDADGVLRVNPIAAAPPEATGGSRQGDERFETMTGRRPMVEAAFGRTAADHPGIAVRRGTAVTNLLTDGPSPSGVPHVVGVRTDTGEEVRADLVVDSSGRRSPLPSMLADIGARPPVEEAEDSGFMYYGRHYRSPDGTLPFAFGPALQPYESLSLLTLPADNGTWGIGVVTAAGDADLRPAKGVDVWERIVGSYPLVAHWIDAEPITGIQLMAGIQDRHRAFVVDGVPVATGVAPVADSWACTNPSVGRGASIGLLHAVALRDLVRKEGLADPTSFALAWHETTADTVEPLYRDTLSFDRHRLGEIEAQIAGVPYQPDDPEWATTSALQNLSGKDPDLLRGFVDIISLHARADEVLARPGVLDRLLQLADGPIEAAPGPTRPELLDIVRSA